LVFQHHYFFGMKPCKQRKKVNRKRTILILTVMVEWFFSTFFCVTCPIWLSLFFRFFCHQVVHLFHLVFRSCRDLNPRPRTMSPQRSPLDQWAFLGWMISANKFEQSVLDSLTFLFYSLSQEEEECSGIHARDFSKWTVVNQCLCFSVVALAGVNIIKESTISP